MKVREYFPLGLAVVALILAVVQMFHPFGFLIHPSLLVVIAFLLGLRHLMRRQQQRKREELLKSVPPHPLGLDDDQRTRDHRTNE